MRLQRKVRAPQGGVPDNVRRGQPPGKCHRNGDRLRPLGEGKGGKVR